ncbi:DUF1835 domain-containing protein [Enterobacter asburiae]|uniref:DUF1835 domain-containing protein n=1 Tax=Enterobacter asburiae TaxID=61645 RepID=UPI002075111F|nr:DUF1835 domain-containing protein [Enterobacter asburiae]
MRHRHIALKGAAEGVIRQAFPLDEVSGFPDTLSLGPLVDIGQPVVLYRRMLWIQSFLRRCGAGDDTASRYDGLAVLLAVLQDADRVTVWVGDHPDEQLMLHALAPYLPTHSTVVSVSRHLRIVDAGTALPEIVRTLDHQGISLDDIWRERLETAWLALTRQRATLYILNDGIMRAADENCLDETILRVLTRSGHYGQDIISQVTTLSGILACREWLLWRIRYLQGNAQQN